LLVGVFTDGVGGARHCGQVFAHGAKRIGREALIPIVTS
jgi:hypothetical protein